MDTLHAPPTEAAVSIPENANHAVSVSLPLWKHNVAYEEGDKELSEKMKSGYPRFKIHFKIEGLVERIEREYGREGERAMIFSSYGAARRCREFIKKRHSDAFIRVLQLSSPKQSDDSLDVKIAIVLFDADLFPVAKQYWQHTGEGISSRQAQYFLERLEEQDQLKAESLITGSIPSTASFPSSISAGKLSSSVTKSASSLETRKASPDVAGDEDAGLKSVTQPQEAFVEERFGRYLPTKLVDEAKPALKNRISREISRRGKIPINPEHIYLYPSGMTAIFSAYRIIMEAFKTEKSQTKAVCFGFPYTDTLKVLQKWGPGAEFFPVGDDAGDLAKLEQQLRGGLKISCVLCEVPSNPLLNTPNLVKLHALSREFGFAIIVDDTVGNMANVDTLSYSDITVSSLTKIFSGDCNVMAGDLILNPTSPHFELFKATLDSQFQDTLWAEDAIYLERNSRDFYARNKQINENAEALVELLVHNWKKHPSQIIKSVQYPKVSSTRANYDAIKYEDGGYGGLLSVVFHKPAAGIAFFDTLFIAKGPSLGTNFTLGCPYTIIAHYNELDFVNSCGVDTHLVRISIGLEDKDELIQRFQVALDAAEHAASA